MNGFSLDVEGSREHVTRIVTAVQKVLGEIDREAGYEVQTETGVRFVRRPWPVSVRIQFRGQGTPAAQRRALRREISV